MNAVERVVGGWIHRVIAARPRAHAELLNQYRSSEDFGRRFPDTLCAELLPEGPLKVKYVKHQADEERHEALYAARIRALGGEPAPVGEARDYMPAVWRAAGEEGVGIPLARFAEKRPLAAGELARLWALQTVVEERGLEEMALHRGACAACADLLDAILPDERHHAAYSRKALEDSGSGWEALLARMRAAEARAHRAVSGAFLKSLVFGGAS